MPPQAFTVERRDHPFGEEGVRRSLEEVANYILKGYTHPKVVAWAQECLERARKERGVPCKTERQRAEVLLRSVQKKLWIPDPVGTEWMAGAHLMACDRTTKDELCIAPQDCDDRVVICGSSMMAVGLYCCVVGHGYNAKQDIEHVLLTVRLDGQWAYADPSEPSLPLGKCVKPSRERVISLPNNKVICDARACFTNPSDYDPIKSGFVEKGVFVGVNGVPAGIPDFVEPTPEILWKIGVGTGVEWL